MQLFKNGEKIDGRYEIISQLGQGGMGTVYLVEDLEGDRERFALKVLNPFRLNDSRFIERFEKEAAIVKKLTHDNIVNFFGFTKKESFYFFLMEYVDGQSLRDIIDQTPGGKLPFDQVIKILQGIAEALKYLHNKGIVHRDLKPENILITKDSKVKLADFGIALSLEDQQRITETQDGIVGTRLYISPEQLQGYKATPRSDIYAFGLIAYELASGLYPYTTQMPNNAEALAIAHLAQPLPKITSEDKSIPRWFQDFLFKCTAKDPADRCQSIEEFAHALDLYYIEESEWEAPSGNEAGKVGGSAIKNFFLRILYRAGCHKPRIRNALIKYIFCLLISGLPVFLFWPKGGPIQDSIDVFLMDNWFRVRGPLPAPKDVIFIGIDKASYEHFGVLPREKWPRHLTTELLNTLRDKNPRQIILDLKFEAIEDEKVDQELVTAMANTPTYISKVLTTSHEYEPAELQNKEVQSWEDSHPLFIKAAKGVFFANLRIDPKSGAIRKFNLEAGTDRRVTPIAHVLYGDSAAGKSLPGREDYINYYGPAGTIITLPFYKVIDKNVELPDDLYRDKIIFVGLKIEVAHNQRAADTFPTPYRGYTYGAEIHATTAANILNQEWIRRLKLGTEIIIIYFASFLITYIILDGSVFRGFFISLGLIISWAFASYLMFIYGLFFPASVVFFFLVPTVYIALLMKDYLRKWLNYRAFKKLKY